MRILVVDDERELVGALRGGLEADGYAVDVAHHGRDALYLAGLHPYRAIVLDVMLPGLNGYRVCRRLRESGSAVPVLMLTAKSGVHDEVEALDTGADDYLAKPFAYSVLTARLRALIRRGTARTPALLRVGDLTVDLLERRCRRGAVEIALTAREFAVLCCLARRPGEVVAKRDIIDEVWDMAFDGDVNVVEVHISALRRKIDKPFRQLGIETVRGIGYRLVDGRG